MSELNAQNLANTACAFARMMQLHEKLFAVLAREAERRQSEVNAQDHASTAWAFATQRRTGG